MKRSQINQLMTEALAFMDRYAFRLPPFGYWSPDDWAAAGSECRSIVDQQLGWDITDFGLGDFHRRGLLLFTLRNGDPSDPAGKPYAEKIMIVRENQITPAHFHWKKMEDIINRGGGELVIQLWNSDDNEGLADSPITVMCDGVERNVEPGGTITLSAGESVTLTPYLYHQFWAADGKGDALIGEVSRVNDDHTDNRFADPIGRFPTIEEDQPPQHLLVGDYDKYFKP